MPTHFCTTMCGCNRMLDSGATFAGYNTITTNNTAYQLWNGPPPRDYAREQQEMMRVMQSLQVQQPPKAKEQKPVRGLFEVFIVDPTGHVSKDGIALTQPGDVPYECKVVANSEESAKMKALIAFQSADDLSHYRGRDIEDFDVIVRRVGNVRPIRSVQEVRVIKDG